MDSVPNKYETHIENKHHQESIDKKISKLYCKQLHKIQGCDRDKPILSGITISTRHQQVYKNQRLIPYAPPERRNEDKSSPPAAEGPGPAKKPPLMAAMEEKGQLLMNPLLSLILLGSVVLALGCAPAPGATNLARTGVASQVSDYPYSTWSGLAKNAIDGNKDTDFNSDSCTHTNLEKDPWWKLDLKQSYKISIVILTNRMDCCPERLMGAEVRIGNSPDNNNPVCGTVTSVTTSTLTFCCPGMEGRYISVVIPGRSEYLSMCEVEAYSDSVTNQDKVCS
ncbi:uncharacterized protein [Ranitomeya imitator]|uniref:uncharacterized protein n=1 Tax=Ranitomeya imitator TaxID=111125 RepID=UPI0037E73B0C